MERSIIHHNHSLWRKCRKKLLFKPKLEQNAVHRTRIFHRREDLLTKLGRNNPNSFILAAIDCSTDPLSSGGIPIFPIQIGINPSFIYICDLFRCNFCDFLLVRCYLFWLLFPIMHRLFLRVMPTRLNALRIAVSQQLNSFAISFGYASGCSCTYAFSFSGSIFL